MNVTELARRIKIPTSELKELLPRLGFDIGKKAIKVDDKSAQMIIEKIKANPQVIQQLRDEKVEKKEEKPDIETKSTDTISLPSVITVRDFAAILNKPVATIIQELMKNGILANLNEQIDYTTANIIAEDMGFTTVAEKEESKADKEDTKIEELLGNGNKNTKPRPPVVVVMGHVDHGKTKLLDAIRKTDVIAGESGGITQHIGAYQVTKNKKTITFIDTPGHEAFTAMRSRGARVADIAILVIAADDGIKPQTEEAIQIIANAKLPFIVAINKIDKPEADIEKVKQQLAQKDLLPEDWGGKVICVPVAAKTGQGIDDLLDHLLLVAEVEKDNIKSDPDRTAIGTIIESHIDKGEGPVATAIIQSGALHQGNVVQVGEVVGKIKALKDYMGRPIQVAGPSVPVKILGLKNIPEVGDVLQTTAEGESLKKMVKKIKRQSKLYRDKQKWQTVQTKQDETKKKDKILNIILKSDVQGSQEAIMQSLEMLQKKNIKVKIIKKGLGNINDADILQAESSEAHIYGFNVKPDARAQELAAEKKIHIHLYNVIYDLTDHVKKEVDQLVDIKKEIIELGRVKVIAVFRTEKNKMIIGGLVTKGKIEDQAIARISRNDAIIGEGKIIQLQQAKQEKNSVPSGTECGIQIKTPITLAKDDFLEIYKEELIKPAH